MSASSRLGWALGVALMAHAGMFTWATLRGSAGPSKPKPVDAVEVSIDVEPPSPEPVPETVHPTALPTEATAGERLGHRVSPDAVAHGGGRSNGAPGEAPSASPEPEAGAEGSWTFSPTVGSSPAGPLGGSALEEATRAGVAATVAEESRKDATRQKHLPIFTAHDVALGLVPGGVLVSLSRELVRRSRVPTTSRALLQFDTDGAGLVASVRVLDASSGRAEWNEVATQIAADARSRPLTVPSGARGMAVTVEVTSALRTVNGADPNTGAVAKALGAINDPIGTAAAGPPVRVIASHIVDVRVF